LFAIGRSTKIGIRAQLARGLRGSSTGQQGRN
jgi:hypothetical protein